MRHLWRYLILLGSLAGVCGALAAGAATPPTNVVSGDNDLFLPVIHRLSPCDNPPYNEPIRYNMDRIAAPEAWACHWEGRDVVVAVIDTGADLTHPELAANLVPGKSFIAGADTPNDDNGHGSHVAGIVAAVANNGGVVGVAPRAKIMPIKALNFLGSGTETGVAAGITWATDHGAQIINMSLGSTVYSVPIADAVDYAASEGVVLVAAAGNCGDHNYPYNGCTYEDQPAYPAALAQVIAVAATTESNQQASFSTSGVYVEVAAPGVNIFSTYAFGEYAQFSGTSQAAPHVAGLAALIWAQHPSYAAWQVRSAISGTAVDLGPTGFDVAFGYGLINAPAAVSMQYASRDLPAATVLPATRSDSAEFVPGEVVIKLAPGSTPAQVWQAIGERAPLTVLETLPDLALARLAAPAGQELALIARLAGAPGVLYAGLNHVVRAY